MSFDGIILGEDEAKIVAEKAQKIPRGEVRMGEDVARWIDRVSGLFRGFFGLLGPHCMSRRSEDFLLSRIDKCANLCTDVLKKHQMERRVIQCDICGP